LSLLIAPLLIHYLYKYKCWKKKPREKSISGDDTYYFTKFHKEKEVSTPRMGGILIWATTILVVVGVLLLSYFLPSPWAEKINFLSRSQTWLPIFTLVASSLIGLVDDILVINNQGKYIGGGMRFKLRLGLILLIAVVGAWWFYYKLGWSTINIPFYGNLEIDGLYILLFILVVIATYSGGVVDGLDGLSAGVLIPIFASFGVISYAKGLYDLTVLISIIISTLITYLWFNVHPAKFYMGETGIMGLTTTLAIIALLTNTVLFLPIIAFILVIESASVSLQLLSKKFLKRKIFLAAPIHHHFEALGWHESQITMRFWIVSAVMSGLGLLLFFLSKFL
jgi:phospho-N-acetylmuramoyl-pentapeptide-transferase